MSAPRPISLRECWINTWEKCPTNPEFLGTPQQDPATHWWILDSKLWFYSGNGFGSL